MSLALRVSLVLQKRSGCLGKFIVVGFMFLFFSVFSLEVTYIYIYIYINVI